MAKQCLLCNKKLSLFGSSSPIVLSNQTAPITRLKYGDIKPVSIPQDMVICEECFKMTAYLYAFKWKDRLITAERLNYTDQCTNEDIELAQTYIKSKVCNVINDKHKTFFINALKMSEQIVQRRNGFSQLTNDSKKRLKDYYDRRLQSIETILNEFNKGHYNDDSTFGATDIELVYCPIDLIAEKLRLKKKYKEIVDVINHSTPNENTEALVTDFIQGKEIEIYRYKLTDIVYFKVNDRRQYVSNVHGGGGSGGGSNLAGAVIGGALFGGAGAIVGSQVGTEIKIDPIETDISEVGECITTLVLNNGCSIEFTGESSSKALMTLIPYKEYSYVASNEKTDNNPIKESQSHTNSSANSVADELRQFKSLLDEGIITQEEFDKKKKELLSL